MSLGTIRSEADWVYPTIKGGKGAAVPPPPAPTEDGVHVNPLVASDAECRKGGGGEGGGDDDDDDDDGDDLRGTLKFKKTEAIETKGLVEAKEDTKVRD